MLDSLQIKNFRIFRDLQIQRLGRVNLLVGKNNSGKTCLLEALRVYGHRGDPSVLDEMVRARDEDLVGLVDDVPAGSEFESSGVDPRVALSDPVCNLFHGHRFPSNPRKAIEVGPVQGGTRLRLSPRAYRRVSVDDAGGTFSYAPLDITSWDELTSNADTAESRPHIRLVAELCQDEERRPVFFIRLPLRLGHTWESDPTVNVRYVPVRYMEEPEMAALWDVVVVRPKVRQHVVEALRLIDPDIQEVVMLQGKRSHGPVPVVLYGDDTRLPLRSLGDGVLHLFHIILAAVSTKGGTVLFDEVENGLHWSVQPLVWKTLFDLAVALDLQVFATTHSWDCVHAFKNVATEHEAEAMLLHLGRSVRKSQQGAIVVTEYDKDSLEQATRAGLEVR